MMDACGWFNFGFVVGGVVVLAVIGMVQWRCGK